MRESYSAYELLSQPSYFKKLSEGKSELNTFSFLMSLKHIKLVNLHCNASQSVAVNAIDNESYYALDKYPGSFFIAIYSLLFVEQWLSSSKCY